jgi:hypothetical protein
MTDGYTPTLGDVLNTEIRYNGIRTLQFTDPGFCDGFSLLSENRLVLCLVPLAAIHPNNRLDLMRLFRVSSHLYTVHFLVSPLLSRQ